MSTRSEIADPPEAELEMRATDTPVATACGKSLYCDAEADLLLNQNDSQGQLKGKSIQEVCTKPQEAITRLQEEEEADVGASQVPHEALDWFYTDNRHHIHWNIIKLKRRSPYPPARILSNVGPDGKLYFLVERQQPM